MHLRAAGQPLDSAGEGWFTGTTRLDFVYGTGVALPLSRPVVSDVCGAYPVIVPLSKEEMEPHVHHHYREEKHLQSTGAVNGYEIQALDGPLGAVSGFMVDDKSWAIRELVVETGHWYAGKEVLIASTKIDRISYEESKVFVNLTKADIERTGEHKVVHARTENLGAGSFPKE